MSDILEIAGLAATRGNKTVLNDINLRLEAGKTVALLGPNGAGKSSLVLALAGMVPVTAGTVTLNDTLLNGLSPDKVRQAGIASVPEGHQVLTRLSVEDNIRVAADDPTTALEQAAEIFPELREFKDRAADSLSGGQQQMVALAQALVSNPKFILADEMSLGLAPVIVRRLMGVVRQIAASGVGVLLIEQFTHVALELADYAYVLNRGRIVFSGTPDELLSNEKILEEAYLATSA